MYSIHIRPGAGQKAGQRVQLPSGTVLAVATALRNSIHQRTFDRGLGTQGVPLSRKKYSRRHAERRMAAGRTTAKVDHSFTGAMAQGFRVLSVSESVAHIGNADHTAGRASGTDKTRPWRVPSDGDRAAAREVLRDILDGVE